MRTFVAAARYRPAGTREALPGTMPVAFRLTGAGLRPASCCHYFNPDFLRLKTWGFRCG
jgi:hypothetical protein